MTSESQEKKLEVLKTLDHDFRFRWQLLKYMFSLKEVENIISLENFFAFPDFSGVGDVNFLKQSKKESKHTLEAQIEILCFVHHCLDEFTGEDSEFHATANLNFPKDLLELWNPI